MTCDTFLAQLPALLDGETLPEAAADAERHLVTCAECAQARADIAEMRGLASAWTINAPDISGRVMSVIALDDQRLLLEEMQRLLEEMQRLRAEMQALRAEVAALRQQLSFRSEASLWMPPARPDYSKSDYARMENDPWNLTRS